jgi:DNA-binding IclR family transcriptional regulator
MTTTPDAKQTLTAVEKTLNIIEALWRLDGAGVTELASQLNAPKSTIHSHLSTLHRKGYVVKDGSTYSLSLRFLTFGEHAKHAQPLYDVAKPAIEDLAEETSERVLCMVEQHGLGIVLCAGEHETSLETNVTVGTNSYLHCSAAGKAMLAHMSEERINEILDRWGLERFTEHTITDREQLFAELDTVRDRGVAFNREEYLMGVNSVGAAITDDDERAIGAVAVSGAAKRLDGDRLTEAVPRELLGTLNVIEVNMLFSSTTG